MEFYFLNWVQLSCDFGKVVPSGTTPRQVLLETIPNHVVSWVQVEPKKWKQLMDHCQELACFINLGDHVMEAINWRINCEYMKFQANDVH